MNRRPVILPLPTGGEIEKMVDDLIAPESADKEARILIEILTSVADFETPEKANLADAVIKAAYAKTFHCERVIKHGLSGFMRRADNPAPAENEESDQSACIG